MLRILSLYDSFSWMATTSIVFFIAFLLFSQTVIAAGPNTVQVNAVIQAAQVLHVDGDREGGSKKKALIPVNQNGYEEVSPDRIRMAGSSELSLGSNTKWHLYAEVKNLEDTRDLLNRSGWKVESFTINYQRRSIELNEEPEEVIAGDPGSFNMEISFRLVLTKTKNPNKERPPVEELTNVLVFSIQ